jgi:hypothetical protein
MTDDILPFPSRAYFLFLGILVMARGMDVLSTWMATPNLVLEGNPVAKALGWRWGLPINFGFCLVLAFWPLPAVVISTTSVLVAARNFQSAWLMRSMGEQAYRDWHVARIQETRSTLFLACLAGNTLLTAAVGGVLIFFSNMLLVPFGIGVGMVAYAGAVLVFTLFGIVRLRRAERAEQAERVRLFSFGRKTGVLDLSPSGQTSMMAFLTLVILIVILIVIGL